MKTLVDLSNNMYSLQFGGHWLENGKWTDWLPGTRLDISATDYGYVELNKNGGLGNLKYFYSKEDRDYKQYITLLDEISSTRFFKFYSDGTFATSVNALSWSSNVNGTWSLITEQGLKELEAERARVARVAAQRARERVEAIEKATGKKLAKGNYNISWTLATASASYTPADPAASPQSLWNRHWLTAGITGINVSFTVVDPDTITIRVSSSSLSTYKWDQDAKRYYYTSKDPILNKGLRHYLKFIDNAGNLYVFYDAIQFEEGSLDKNTLWNNGVCTTSGEALPQDGSSKAENWLYDTIQAARGKELQRGPYSITWSLNNNEWFNNKITFSIENPEIINITKDGSTMLQYNYSQLSERYEYETMDPSKNYVITYYLKFEKNTNADYYTTKTGNLKVFAGYDAGVTAKGICTFTGLTEEEIKKAEAQAKAQAEAQATARKGAEVKTVKKATGKKLAKGNYNIVYTKSSSPNTTTIDMSFTMIDPDTLHLPGEDDILFREYKWSQVYQGYSRMSPTSMFDMTSTYYLKFIDNLGNLYVFNGLIASDLDSTSHSIDSYGACRTSEEAFQPQDTGKVKEWLEKGVEEVLLDLPGNKLAKGDYSITWTLNNSKWFSKKNKISLIIDDPETINIKVDVKIDEGVYQSMTLQYKWSERQRYESKDNTVEALNQITNDYLKFKGNTGNLKVFAGYFSPVDLIGENDYETANGTYTPVVNYNEFLTTSYTVDYVNSVNEFVLLRPNGEPETNINSNTTIIKELLDNNGVVFTQSAWSQVRSHIFKI